LLHAGLVVASRSLVATAVGLALLLLIYRREVVRDEALLAERLGQIFIQYKLAVGAFLPQFAPWSPPAGSSLQRAVPFSLRMAILEGRKRELDALVAGGVVFALLVIASQTAELFWFRVGAVLCVGLFIAFRFIYYRRGRA
jgi:protein-S-isoprenylcysteine O-methyltransferase Ste14